MSESTTSGRQVLGHMLGRRQVAARLARLVIAIALAQVAGVLVVDMAIEHTPSTTDQWVTAFVSGLIALATIALLSGRPLRRELQSARQVAAAREEEANQRSVAQQFMRDINDAFEMAERDEDLFAAAARALAMASPGRSEILVADASNAHLNRLAVSDGREPPGCSVSTPTACPAVRRGKTMLFGDVEALAVCPRLRERQLGSNVVAACIPVTVLGAPTAVLHSTCDVAMSEDELAAGVHRLEGIAVRFGSRLVLMRATARARLQADHDPLTGLLNRRALENRVRELMLNDVPMSLAMIDLDHFKVLNDTHGHETGDRALRLFARAVRGAMRDQDIVARFGGEEFVAVLPHSDVTTSAPVMHRIRASLRDELASAEVPPFTCSIGLVDTQSGLDFFGMVRAADRALLTAKAAGRDRLVIGDTEEDSHDGSVESIESVAPVTPVTPVDQLA